MSDDDKKGTAAEFSTADRLKWIGGGVTIVWLSAIALYVCVNWAKVFVLEPNAVGDFLAGAFAPLAFFWLVLGFFQQGAELRNSGRALWLQGEELRNSVEQQRDLVNVTREQLAFESNRLSQDREEIRRKSQPDLEIERGGYSQSGQDLSVRFYIKNHGRTCTRVSVDLHGRIENLKFGSIESGLDRDFIVQSKRGESENIDIDIGYLDNNLEEGVSYFTIRGNMPDVTIEKSRPQLAF